MGGVLVMGDGGIILKSGGEGDAPLRTMLSL